MGALVKLLGQRLDSFQIAFFRALTGALFILPFMIRQGPAAFRFERPWLHLARGLAGSAAMMCGFYSFVYLPLADATAISFARALFLVPLAMIVLHEAVGGRRWAATLIGFLGVVIVAQPSGTFAFAALVGAFGAFLVAVAVVLVKILTRTNHPNTLLLSSGIIGTVATAVPAALYWQMPTWEEVVLLLAMGAFGVGAHSCFIRAYRVGEATALAPLDYTRLVFAGALGFILFADVPGPHTLAGSVIIVASTLYITYREAQKARAGQKAEAKLPSPTLRGRTADAALEKDRSGR
jgi:drug/metabolite transporter (DMT)-like permease